MSESKWGWRKPPGNAGVGMGDRQVWCIDDEAATGPYLEWPTAVLDHERWAPVATPEEVVRLVEERDEARLCGHCARVVPMTESVRCRECAKAYGADLAIRERDAALARAEAAEAGEKQQRGVADARASQIRWIRNQRDVARQAREKAEAERDALRALVPAGFRDGYRRGWNDRNVCNPYLTRPIHDDAEAWDDSDTRDSLRALDAEDTP